MPAQMKWPCRHVLSTVGKRDPKMYGIRWYSLYQHCYCRPGKEKFTERFNIMMSDEACRKANEDVLVEGLLSPSSPDSSFPKRIGDTSKEEEDLILRLRHWKLKGKCLVRGETVPLTPDEQQGDDEENGFHCPLPESDTEQDMSIEVHHSEVAASILTQDVLLTQTNQTEEIPRISQSTENKDQELCNLMRKTLKLVEDDDEHYNEIKLGYEELHSKAVKLHLEKNPKKNNNDGEGFEFPVTGTHKQKKVKRKRGVTDYLT
jgi:hypothetical protein